MSSLNDLRRLEHRENFILRVIVITRDVIFSGTFFCNIFFPAEGSSDNQIWSTNILPWDFGRAEPYVDALMCYKNRLAVSVFWNPKLHDSCVDYENTAHLSTCKHAIMDKRLAFFFLNVKLYFPLCRKSIKSVNTWYIMLDKCSDYVKQIQANKPS